MLYHNPAKPCYCESFSPSVVILVVKANIDSWDEPIALRHKHPKLLFFAIVALHLGRFEMNPFYSDEDLGGDLVTRSLGLKEHFLEVDVGVKEQGLQSDIVIRLQG